MPVEYKHAIVKFNGGRGALLCNGCRTIIVYGFEHNDQEYFCVKCEPKGAINDSDVSSN